MRRFFIIVIASFWLPAITMAAEAELQKQIDLLTTRVEMLEQLVSSLSGSNNWKDPLYWSKLKRDMPEMDVVKIMGKADRIEEQVFTTWYYHPTSRMHSFIWFDDGKVLGWKLPDSAGQ
jgi:hypothetical protein